MFVCARVKKHRENRNFIKFDQTWFDMGNSNPLSDFKNLEAWFLCLSMSLIVVSLLLCSIELFFRSFDCVYTREMWVFWIIFAAVRLTNDLRTTWNRNERDELTVSLNDRRLPILWWWNRNNVPDFITFKNICLWEYGHCNKNSKI